jgi:vacuolar iron transporter family protein
VRPSARTRPPTRSPRSSPTGRSDRDRRRWARYLVDERAEARVYRALAARREDGEERQILLALAEAEGRHESHWRGLLGGEPHRLPRAGAGTLFLGWLAKRFGSIFVLALGLLFGVQMG